MRRLAARDAAAETVKIWAGTGQGLAAASSAGGTLGMARAETGPEGMAQEAMVREEMNGGALEVPVDVVDSQGAGNSHRA